MAAEEIHVGDIGTKFLITLKDGSDIVDISATSTLQIIFHKPDSTLSTKSATLETDGTDGELYYTTSSSDDLDQEGYWKLQAYVEFNSGSKFHSDISGFRVYPNLN